LEGIVNRVHQQTEDIHNSLDIIKTFITQNSDPDRLTYSIKLEDDKLSELKEGINNIKSLIQLKMNPVEETKTEDNKSTKEQN